ncbi:epidermal retinol dehydrogenase 2 [Anolis carolinensis]|uniref:Hydroxysteroid 17-beta dehydrogenase 11 n=1 Tax=Anolis carolinensis TaxID=28377 RepID=A0A803T7T3_ANOCA|nr:PREDICTED: epidermal retinol dehydrogenase 2 [Anolis carolinensis]|eukprot:XP_016853516.1 PREDICTED: epidermal retinol dehydrogenase 2 [Anolis carolinensis]
MGKNMLKKSFFAMRSILDTFKFIILFIYYCLEAFVLMFFCVRKNVAGKIVLVTGSADGIGRQIALNFARLRTILVLWDIDEEGNKKTAELVKANGALAVYVYKCDVRIREEIYAVANQVKKEVGDVDILINNAGIYNRKNFPDLSDSAMEETIQVNTKAHFWTCKAFLPAMLAQNQGHLVTIASAASLSGDKYITDYSASKFASFGFLESLAFELWAAGKKGIKTTIVCPGFVDTKLIIGVKTARPFLVPIMDVGLVGRNIVDAILKEKLYIVLPPFTRLITLKIFLPKKVGFLINQYLRP